MMPDPALLLERNGVQNQPAPVSPEARATMEEMVRDSVAMNFEVADQAPAERLNEIIWASVKGFDSPLPPTPRGPQGSWIRNDSDEDDDKDDDD
jgi:hypothetical protein